MLRTENRRIKKCQLADMKISFIDEYYADINRVNDIILVFDNGNLKTLLGFKDYENIENQQQLDFYLKYSANCSFNNSMESASKIFERFPMYNYLIVGIGSEWGNFICKIRGGGIREINDIYTRLKKNNVHVYRVKIPSIGEIDNDKCYDADCNFNLDELARCISSGVVQESQYLDKMTDIKLKHGTKMCNLYGKKLGNKKRKIYIIGPCIVFGDANPEKESLSEILFEKMTQFGYEYSILPIRQEIGVNNADNFSILTCNIKKNDIVIFLNRYMGDEWDLDTTPLYNSYNGLKWLFQDVPIHTTVTGNRIIADFLIKKIIKPVSSLSLYADDDIIVYDGEPQFTYDMQDDIEKYIENVRKTRMINSLISDFGAIVMNCNPFTNGHRYLVEYASRHVDYLYLFVVEEDLSAVPFSDRFIMVYEGVKDIDNVIVVPSGHFIISKLTFQSYFNKKTEIRNVNAEEDAYIFARYIAKGLNISKRFVGEEPTDYVTNVYNQTMKKVFGKYGIELIEIPRKELDNGKIISATEVRKLLLKDKWSEISKYVPQSTLDYLRKIKDTIKQRIEKQSDIQNQIENFVDMVCHFDKVVIYTVGHDTKGLLEYLPMDVVERFEYCDKSAKNGEFTFNGKIVEPPEQLMQKYSDYTIIVTSTRFGAEIYEEFIKMGIEMERCIFNLITFDIK